MPEQEVNMGQFVESGFAQQLGALTQAVVDLTEEVKSSHHEYDTILYGNGKPGLVQDVTLLKSDVSGIKKVVEKAKEWWFKASLLAIGASEITGTTDFIDVI